jgi:hypothetical protein
MTLGEWSLGEWSLGEWSLGEWSLGELSLGEPTLSPKNAKGLLWAGWGVASQSIWFTKKRCEKILTFNFN